ncbi:MAG: hypothetical protein QNK05_05185 [Myxococcota bacterium]|nr:hypothetical protein [Myxococcota bacterium]
MRRWMTLCVLGLALTLGTAAFAQPVSGMGGAVGVNLSRSEIRLGDGKVLLVDEDTVITDVDRKAVVSLSEIDLSEGVRELPVRYHGQLVGGVVRAIRVDIGQAALVN